MALQIVAFGFKEKGAGVQGGSMPSNVNRTPCTFFQFKAWGWGEDGFWEFSL